MIRLAICLTAIFATCMVCTAQERNEDVLLTIDGTLFRGTISDKFAPGGTITILPAEGKPSATLWSEVVAIRRLPAAIPDSVIRGSFDHHTKKDAEGKLSRVFEEPRKTPKFDFTGYETHEDVLFLVDGTILRGALINQRSDGTHSFWTSGTWKEIGGRAVVTSARVQRGIPDSTLVYTYLKAPEQWRTGELRIFSVHGGLSVPIGDLATPKSEGRSTTKAGPAIGVEAGIRLSPGFRWLTSGTYSRHSREAPQFFLDAATTISGTTPLNAFQVMTGLEVRMASSSDIRARFAALAGIVSISAGSYEATFPQTYQHLAGTAKVDGISSSSFGFALAGGLLVGRFSLDIKWTYFKPDYTATSTLVYEYGYMDIVKNSAAETSGFLLISLGFSIY